MGCKVWVSSTLRTWISAGVCEHAMAYWRLLFLMTTRSPKARKNLKFHHIHDFSRLSFYCGLDGLDSCELCGRLCLGEDEYFRWSPRSHRCGTCFERLAVNVELDPPRLEAKQSLENGQQQLHLLYADHEDFLKDGLGLCGGCATHTILLQSPVRTWLGQRLELSPKYALQSDTSGRSCAAHRFSVPSTTSSIRRAKPLTTTWSSVRQISLT